MRRGKRGVGREILRAEKEGKIRLNHSTDWHRATLCVNSPLIFTEQINPRGSRAEVL